MHSFERNNWKVLFEHSGSDSLNELPLFVVCGLRIELLFITKVESLSDIPPTYPVFWCCVFGLRTKQEVFRPVWGASGRREVGLAHESDDFVEYGSSTLLSESQKWCKPETTKEKSLPIKNESCNMYRCEQKFFCQPLIVAFCHEALLVSSPCTSSLAQILTTLFFLYISLYLSFSVSLELWLDFSVALFSRSLFLHCSDSCSLFSLSLAFTSVFALAFAFAFSFSLV